MIPTVPVKSLVEAFFRQSAGQWRSQRRYYTLQQQQTLTVESYLSVRFLPAGDPALVQLAQLHHLDDNYRLTSGAIVSWQSHYLEPTPKTLTGTTVFGVHQNLLYRDRGFSTTSPVTARFFMPNPDTLALKTEYGGTLFEEEIRLIGTRYRTRQTIISHAKKHHMIGQYLETRL